MTTAMTTPDTADEPVSIDFCTLGMFIIDEIHPSPKSADQTIKTDVIGGAATYSAVGARLFSPPPRLSQTVAWIVDAGPDFPAAVRDTITAWQTAVVLRPRAGPTTRGWNGYSGNELRSFRYTTPKLRLTAADLTAHQLTSRSFHLICGSQRCIDEVQALRTRQRRAAKGPVSGDSDKGQKDQEVEIGTVVWEPVPDLCTPAEREGLFAALAHVDVISPNHAELAAFFGAAHGEETVGRAMVEEQAQQLVDHGVGRGGNGAVVVRAGAEGCFVLTRTTRKWLPAFHRDAARVIDPTGGGNGFLGGFAVGWVRSGGDVIEAARWGSVAASFTIEQVGMPTLEKPLEAGGQEKWNGDSVLDRLNEFRGRTT